MISKSHPRIDTILQDVDFVLRDFCWGLIYRSRFLLVCFSYFSCVIFTKSLNGSLYKKIFNCPSNNCSYTTFIPLNGAGIFVKDQCITKSLLLGSKLCSSHHQAYPYAASPCLEYQTLDLSNQEKQVFRFHIFLKKNCLGWDWGYSSVGKMHNT